MCFQPTARALELDGDVTVRIEAGGAVVLFIKEEDSQNGKPLAVVSHKVSNTVTMYEGVKGPRHFIRPVQPNKLTHI
jgi:hypothetical protein